jgi:probable rRNA maturation factor
VKVIVFDEQNTLSIPKRPIQKMVKALIEKEKIFTDEVDIYLVQAEFISDLHERFFHDPTPTDCISFPIDSPEESFSGRKILGEVFVCTEIAKEYAVKYGKDPLKETIYYIVHGFLHLIGYQDETRAKKSIMRKKEQECMDFLQNAGFMDFLNS